MSNSSGTLITTHNATYIHPSFMPGYKGYIPSMKFEHGETYGNQTNKYFQDFRSKAFESSKSLSNRGGYFPSKFTSQANLACESRVRGWDRWVQMPTYKLNNQDNVALQRRIQFTKKAMAHREHYNDVTGLVPRVEFFHQAKPFETREMFTTNKNISYCCTHLE